MRLTVRFADGSGQERQRAFLFPTAEEARVTLILGQLLEGMRWPAGAEGLAVALERIQDAVAEQLPLFPAENE